MTKIALKRIVKEVRRHGLFTSIDRDLWMSKPGATSREGWVTCPLTDRLLVESTTRGFDYRGREAEPDDDELEEYHSPAGEVAGALRGDEVIRLSCWSRGELVDILHIDLVTGLKLEVAPARSGSSGHWTTVGVLPGSDR